jgi:hypothetical protein
MSSWDEQLEQCLVAVVAGSGLTWHDYQRGGMREASTAADVTEWRTHRSRETAPLRDATDDPPSRSIKRG